MHSNKSPLLLLCLLAVSLLLSCHRAVRPDMVYNDKDTSDSTDNQEWLPGRDYGRNFNFLVNSDTLWLTPQLPEEALADVPIDSFQVDRNSIVAVVDFRILSADSIDSVWVQVVCDNELIGWTHEQTLLDLFDGVPHFDIDKSALGQPAVELLTQAAAVFPSKGEMRKMVQGGGVSLNKEKLAAFDQVITEADLIDNKYLLVQKGKKNYYLLTVKS